MLEYPGLPTGKPGPPPARQDGEGGEVMKMFDSWGKSQRLVLLEASRSPSGERLKLQVEMKDENRYPLRVFRMRKRGVVSVTL